MRRIELVFFDAGGGHRSAANSLKLAVEQQQRPWELQLLNLQEELDSLDFVHRYLRIPMQDVYNGMLRTGMTLGSAQFIPYLQAGIRLRHRAAVRVLERHWKESNPHMVVSLVPHFNRVLYESFQESFPGRPYVTVLTDLADYPPHFWIERQRQFFICGSDYAVEQARNLGHDHSRILRASGMIIHPRFYERADYDRRRERAALGLDPDRPSALVLFGGYGSRQILEIAERLEQSAADLQLIVICGWNAKLAKKLAGRKPQIPCHIVGFTTQVPYYMQLSDFFIGKPGPGAISEALAMKLPVIVVCNAWTLPQERFNAQWIREKEVGLVLPSFREIAPAVATMLDRANFTRFRTNAAALDNRAVFEIPEMLERIFQLGTNGAGVHASEMRSGSQSD